MTTQHRNSSWLSTIEIPERPLLNAAGEQKLSNAIQTSLDRIERWLLRLPAGLETWLDYMTQAQASRFLPRAWFPLRERLDGDLRRARLYAEQSTLASREKAARVVRNYKVDPERLCSWVEDLAEREANLPGDRARLVNVLSRLRARLLQARDELVLANARLVLYSSLRYRSRGMDRGDFFQEGFLGLQRAALRFDGNRGGRFSTYATYWIRQAIQSSLIDRSTIIRVPARARQMAQRPDTAPTVERTNERERVQRILNGTAVFSCAASTSEPEDASSLGTTFESIPDRDESLHAERIPNAIREALGSLSEKESFILKRRFDTEGRGRATLHEIGARLNLSRERVRQIEASALAKLKYVQPLQELHDHLVESEDLHAPSLVSRHN